MRSIIRTLALPAIAVAVALIFGAGMATQVSAQYPPPGGGVLLTTSNPTPDLGAEVAVAAIVQSPAGDPVPGVDCTFHIAEQPGDDATVDPGPATTGTDGAVSTTVHTGSTPGTIVIGAECGELSAQVTLVTGEAAAPPASLPDTGGGGTPGGTAALWPTLALLAIIGLASTALAWRRTRA